MLWRLRLFKSILNHSHYSIFIMSKGPLSARQVLRDAPLIHHLLKQTDAEQQRLAQLKQLIPAEIAAHCIETHQRGNKLIVFVSSPGWASRLRQLTPGLAKQLDVADIQCRIQPPERQKPAVSNAKKTPPRHSQLGAEAIMATAEATDDPQLGTTLKRLARAVRPKNSPGARKK